MKKLFIVFIALFLNFIFICSSIACTSVKKIDFENAIYFAFGDSITFGADSTKDYEQMDNPYPKLVFERLNLKSYTNYGVSSSTTATAVSSNNGVLPSINTQIHLATGNADIISIMCGANDFTQSVEIGNINDVDTTTFYGSLNDICSYLKETFPDAFIFFMTPYKMFAYKRILYSVSNSSGYVLEDYANAIKEICNKYDFYCLDMFTNGNFESEMYNDTSDGIHPSQNFVKNYTVSQIVSFLNEKCESIN